MDYPKEVVLDACNVLEEHDRTGKSVMKITCGKWYESVVVKIIVNSCRQLLKENDELKAELKKLNQLLEQIKKVLGED